MTATVGEYAERYETIRVEIGEGVAVVVIDRPDARNAITAQVQAELHDVLNDMRERDDVAALIITGAGTRAFAAGADIAQLRERSLHAGLAAKMQHLYDELEAFDKPTIAAVNGYALGGGCELAMACDIRIAADTASFGLPETALSILPGAGGTQRLARLVGTGRAIEMILTGRRISAEEAHRIGLVTSVVSSEVLLEAAQDCARQILARGPLAVRLAKLVVRTGMDTDQHTGLVVERLAQALLYTTDDKREGVEAFLAKRTPTFTGR
jgi:enoyl-CoA hydratase/carnithine racemase